MFSNCSLMSLAFSWKPPGSPSGIQGFSLERRCHGKHFFHLWGLDHLKSDLDLFDFELTDDEMKQLNDYSPSTALMVWPSPPTSGKQRSEMALPEGKSDSWSRKDMEIQVFVLGTWMNVNWLWFFSIYLFSTSKTKLADRKCLLVDHMAWYWFPNSKTRLDSDEKNESVVVACLELHSRMQWLSRLHKQWHDGEVSCIPDFQNGSKWFTVYIHNIPPRRHVSARCWRFTGNQSEEPMLGTLQCTCCLA